MNSELLPPALSALPVRRRETLDILDTSLKLYRRYFWVLLGWSALVSVVALVPLLNYLGFFLTPFLYGAVSCCIAAAVRGQSVKFSQCWEFSKPRYGPLLGSILLSYLVLLGVSIAIVIAGSLIVVAGVAMLANAPEPLQIIGAIVGGVLFTVVFTGLGLVGFGWASMVPIVVCLEDDKRNTGSLSRAFDLLKGNWRRVFGLAMIMGLAVLAFFTIVGAFFALVGGAGASGLFTSRPSSAAVFGLLGTFSAFITLFSMLWSPAQTLVIAVLYLDLRVRREALDLEWSAYATAPPAPPQAALDFQTPNAMNPGAVARLETPSEAAALPSSFAFGSVAPAPQNESQFAPTPPISTLPTETAPPTFSPFAPTEATSQFSPPQPAPPQFSPFEPAPTETAPPFSPYESAPTEVAPPFSPYETASPQSAPIETAPPLVPDSLANAAPSNDLPSDYLPGNDAPSSSFSGGFSAGATPTATPIFDASSGAPNADLPPASSGESEARRD